MKNTGIVRRIDELGRIVIPKEIRKNFKIDRNEAVEMFVEGDTVVLKKFDKFIDDGKLKIVCESLAGACNCPVVIASKKHICASERIANNTLSGNFFEANSENFSLTKTQVSQLPKHLALFGDKFAHVIISPISIELNSEFLIYALFKTNKPSPTEVALATLAASIASKL